jgi:small-conductance mechanosensitive channel/CRP-like cAMP-binding protein
MFDWLRQFDQPAPIAALVIAFCGLVLLRTHPNERRATLRTLVVAGVGFAVWYTLDIFAQHYQRTPFTTWLLELALLLLMIAGARIGIRFIFRVVLGRFGFTRILQDIVFALALIAWLLLRLRMGGMDLSGIVTTSAVVTAAVAFSLQETLGNLFGGLALQLDNSCGVGDWVRIDDKIGQIIGVRWRYTSVATIAGETFLIPNGFMIKNRISVVAHRGEQVVPWRRHIYFNVVYSIPPAHVIQTVTAALTASSIENVAADPRPICMLSDITGSSARYDVRYGIINPGTEEPTASAVRMHVFAALARAGISLSMPEQLIHLIQQDERYAALQQKHELVWRSAALRRVEIFASLDEHELTTLAQGVHVAPFAPGDTITRQGSSAQCLFVLGEGEVEVFVEGENGSRRELAKLAAPGYFGEMGLMTGAPRTATVIALTDVVCYRVDKEAFETILLARPQIVEHISSTLAARQIANERTLASTDTVTATHTRAQELLRRIRSFFGLSQS